MVQGNIGVCALENNNRMIEIHDDNKTSACLVFLKECWDVLKVDFSTLRTEISIRVIRSSADAIKV